MSASQRDRVIESIRSHQQFVEEVGQAKLKLHERQLQLMADWSTGISTLSFAIGAAIIPLMSQFSGSSKVSHPAYLALAAGILVFNGTLILIIRKLRIDGESNIIRYVGLRPLVSLQKTMNLEAQYLNGKIDYITLRKRDAQQVAEAMTIVEDDSRGRPKDNISLELDLYLGFMLLGFSFIGASVIKDATLLFYYQESALLLAAIFLIYILWSYHRAHNARIGAVKLEDQLKKLQNTYGE